jgi:hypothetical protein
MALAVAQLTAQAVRLAVRPAPGTVVEPQKVGIPLGEPLPPQGLRVEVTKVLREARRRQVVAVPDPCVQPKVR